MYSSVAELHITFILVSHLFATYFANKNREEILLRLKPKKHFHSQKATALNDFSKATS